MASLVLNLTLLVFLVFSPLLCFGQDGQWGSWSIVGADCTLDSCATRTRVRVCVGTATCVGNGTEVTQCNPDICPVDGGWSAWSMWGVCSLSCGTGGIQSRIRACNNPSPQRNGKNCDGSDSSSQSCALLACPVNGGWSQWSAWSPCPITCGINGTQVRSRSCTNPTPVNNGANCVGASGDSQPCTDLQRCPVNGGWSSWSDWTACHVTCGGGTQISSRLCNNPPPSDNGLTCSGNNSRVQPCNTQPCSVDGGWTEWSTWSLCSASCGTSMRFSLRTCTNPAPAYGGQPCYGDSSQSNSCQTVNCPVDGAWSQWSPWGVCSTTCGSGNMSRVRACDSPQPQFNGRDCPGTARETQSCSTLFVCPVDGGWSTWSGWSLCSATCGRNTVKSRIRVCNNPLPSNGGSTCPGAGSDSQLCNNLFECPVDGSWSAWSTWSDCSATCGPSTRTAIRWCNNPAPQNSGQLCPGSNSREEMCLTADCFDEEVSIAEKLSNARMASDIAAMHGRNMPCGARRALTGSYYGSARRLQRDRSGK